jgi:hypothetical protein
MSWTGLDVLHHSASGDAAVVEFVAAPIHEYRHEAHGDTGRRGRGQC